MLLSSSGSGGQIALGVRFYLKDQFSKPVRNMRTAMAGYRGEFQAFQENLRSARNVALGVAAAGAMATRGLYSAAMEGAEFLYIMKGVEAITEGTNQQMETLNSQAIKLGRATMFMPEQIASGMRFMAMAGQSATVIDQTIEAFTNLAGATMTPLGGKMGAADIGTNALKAFGWEAARSAEMSDILVAATTNANVSLLDLGNSIRYVSATSRNLQIPVQETIGLLMSLGNAGIQSSMAGTALENMYRYLARSLTGNASKKAREAWESMGIGRTDVTTAAGRFKPMVEILGMMNAAMEGMDPIEVQAIFRNIFGVRGVRGAATIARNLKEAGGFVGMLSDSSKIGGTAAEKMKIMMDSLKGSSDQLISAWKGVKVAFADATGKWLIPLMNGLKKIFIIITDIIKTPFGGFLASVTFAVVALTTVVASLAAAFLTVAYAMKSMTVSVGGMVGAIGIAKGLMGFGSGALMAAGLTPAANMAGVSTMAGANWAVARSQLHSKSGNVSGLGGASRNAAGQFAKTPLPQRRAPLILGSPAAPLTKGLSKTTSMLGRVARVGGRFLGFMTGPWGLAIMGVATAGTILYNTMQANTEAIKKNTFHLAEKNLLPQEVWALIQGRKVGELVKELVDNIVLAREEAVISQERLASVLENRDMEEIISMFLSMQGTAIALQKRGEQ